MTQRESNEWPVPYYNYLYDYATCKINDEELVKDLVQETMLHALESSNRFQGRSSEMTWLTAIIKYRIYNVYRGRSKSKLIYLEQAELESVSDNGLCENSRKRADVEVLFDKKHFECEINRFLSTIPRKMQLLYDLKYVCEEKSVSICQKLCITKANYWVLSHRLKMSLKKWFTKAMS
jgi:RNA polymerase sigma factor (sigma-70 family)